jgi:hypothetical protein
MTVFSTSELQIDSASFSPSTAMSKLSTDTSSIVRLTINAMFFYLLIYSIFYFRYSSFYIVFCYNNYTQVNRMFRYSVYKTVTSSEDDQSNQISLEVNTKTVLAHS